MIKHYFTVQRLEQKLGAPYWRIVYEGPVESRATAMFQKETIWMDADDGKLPPLCTVAVNDSVVYQGRDTERAKRIYYLRMRELSAPGRKTWTLSFVVDAGDGVSARYAVRPFQERLLGGDPQASVTRTQFSDA